MFYRRLQCNHFHSKKFMGIFWLFFLNELFFNQTVLKKKFKKKLNQETFEKRKKKFWIKEPLKKKSE